MVYEPPPLISRDSARSRRRHRRQQQQSSCCCSVIVLVALVLMLTAWRGTIASWFHRTPAGPAKVGSSAFPLEVGSDAAAYMRNDLVRLQATLVDANGTPVMAPKGPEISVTCQGEVVTTVGNVTRLTLTYDRASGKYTGSWPVPWNAAPGVYLAEARVPISDPQSWVWETPEQRRAREREERRRREKPGPESIAGETYCVASCRFQIQARPRADMPKGMGAATWEPDFREGELVRPTGGKGDWQAMLDWCQYMGADTFWFRGAVTEVYQGELNDATPFNPYNIEHIPEMAAESHRRGLRFGAWAAAYATYPMDARTNRRKPAYQFAKDISRGTGAIRDLDFVSLLEPKRVDHIASFFSKLEADPNVDFVGLDYMRSDRGGYEMVDQFVRDMPVKVPDGFQSWPQARRWSYVAGKVEREWQSDPNFYEQWNWWRAHTGSHVVESIRDKAQLTKPLWIFVLSWWHGKQHGQDPIMFTDAGVSLLCPMLYQVPNRGHFDTMVKQWGEYLQPNQVNLAPGDQVDFYWHQKTLRPAAPEEFYDRIMTAHRGYISSDLTIGTFMHDISRAALGRNKGPYPGTEWALAAGAAFSAIRNNWQVHPFAAKLEVPSSAALGGTCQATLTLQNVTKVAVKRVTLKLADTEGIAGVEGVPQTIPSLGAGQTLTVPVTVKLKGADGSRANRFMVAVFITWPDEDYGGKVRRDLPRQQIVMDYVQGR